MSAWPQLLVLEAKHATDYFLVASEAALHSIALTIVAQRLRFGQFYTEDYDQEKAGYIGRLQSGAAAWRFLQSRSAFEYEGVSLEDFTDPADYEGET